MSACCGSPSSSSVASSRSRSIPKPHPFASCNLVTDPIGIALRVADALEECGIRYLVGGSLASSISGEPRSSMDIDLVVELHLSQVDSLVASLGEDFLADLDTLRRAVERKSSANIIHKESSTKIDLFILGGTSRSDNGGTSWGS